jgi:hypothetical protein
MTTRSQIGLAPFNQPQFVSSSRKSLALETEATQTLVRRRGLNKKVLLKEVTQMSMKLEIDSKGTLLSTYRPLDPLFISVVIIVGILSTLISYILTWQS